MPVTNHRVATLADLRRSRWRDRGRTGRPRAAVGVGGVGLAGPRWLARGCRTRGDARGHALPIWAHASALVATDPDWRSPVACWHPRSDRLAIGTRDAGCRSWQPGGGATRIAKSSRIVTLAWHPEQEMLFGFAGTKSTFSLSWDGCEWREAVLTHPGGPRAWALAPDTRTFAI